MTDAIIARADEGALPACLALLPLLSAPEAVLFTARDADGTLAGAAGLLWESWRDPPGLPAWVHVLPDRRGRGIGRALLARLAAEAAEETDGLWAARALVDGEEAARFAAACGATFMGSQLVFEADPARFLAQIERTMAALRTRGRVPDAAEVVPLAALDDTSEIGHLVVNELRAAPPRIAQLLASASSDDPVAAQVDRERSCVLLIDGQVAGALLSRRDADGEGSYVIANVVAPAWRGGWANAILLEGYARGAVAAGSRRIGFDCADTVRDTIGLARRSGARLVRTDRLFRYATSARAA